MQFEWDDAKSDRCRRERGFGFDFAALIFEGDTLELTDSRHNYGETRIIALGRVDGVHLVVVYVWRNGVRRIISARRAKKGEVNAYRATFDF